MSGGTMSPTLTPTGPAHLYCTAATRASSVVLPKQCAGPALLSAVAGERWGSALQSTEASEGQGEFGTATAHPRGPQTEEVPISHKH